MSAERRVLVVDDEPNIVKVVHRILDAVGYQVLEARNTAEALEKLAKTGPVDCVLLDFSVVGEVCTESFAALTAAQPGLRVVICSGFARAEVAREFPWLAECAGFLKKPFGMDQLITAVATACADQKCTSTKPSGGFGFEREGSTSP